MSTTTTIATVALALLALIVLVGLALGATGGSSTTRLSDVAPGAPTPAPTISELHADDGWTLFGLRLRASHHYVRVQFTVPIDCVTGLASGDPWPPADPACDTDVAIAGVVAGTGRTRDGDGIVNIELEVARACYEALRTRGGDPWPPAVDACAAAGGIP